VKKSTRWIYPPTLHPGGLRMYFKKSPIWGI
jgi:hypothetical protein